MNPLIRFARRYATWGWQVFPLMAHSKRPAVPSHTASGCDRSDPSCVDGHLGWAERATTSIDEINTIWACGRHGLAIATGPSGLLVVDIDHKPGGPNGFDTLAELEARTHQQLPTTTFTVATPSGGLHHYYHVDTSRRAPSTTGRLGPGLDTRGHGGYVVAPPTTLTDGPYHVTCWSPPVPAPNWLLDQLTPPDPHLERSGAGRRAPGRVGRVDRYVEAAVTSEVERVTSAAVGERNHALFLAAIAFGQLVAGELLDEAEAHEILLDAARNQTRQAGEHHDHRQAAATIRSGFDRGLREPRILAPRT